MIHAASLGEAPSIQPPGEYPLSNRFSRIIRGFFLLFFIPFIAKLLKNRGADHGLAQFPQKNAQANKILLREGGVEIIRQRRNHGVQFARIQNKSPKA